MMRLNQQSQTTSANRSGLQANDADALLDNAVTRAQELQTEQAGLLDNLPIELQYRAALAALVEAKHDQAQHLENRLENLIEQQASRLQQAQAQQPGLLALPSQRQRWQLQMQQQQSTLHRLHERFEIVREIKDGMGVHAPRIEEMAGRKLRLQDPTLAAEWDELQEAQRRHQAELRRREQEKSQRTLDRDQRELLGRSMRLSVSPLR